MKALTLDGIWQLAPISESCTNPAKIEKWCEMDVPSHWQQHPDLREKSGMFLYRKTFGFKTEKGKRHFLVLPGIFYWSVVTLNGKRLGEHEGYFTPQQYDVTALLSAENELLVEVNCPDEKERNNKRMITGVFSHWDCLDPMTNPGGIWLEPYILSSEFAHIEACRFHTERLIEKDAQVTLKLAINASSAAKVSCEIKFEPENFKGKKYVFESEMNLKQGDNDFTFSHLLTSPELWWTHDRGNPNLYKLVVTLKQGRHLIDSFAHPVGVRTVRFDNWICSVNGRRLYLKGNNVPPTDTRIAKVSYADCERDILLAKGANLNILRVHAHVDHPSLYEAADRHGVLLWQDFPLQWFYCKEVLPIARLMIRDMIALLYNHPSICLWCCHNEPIYVVDTKDMTFWTNAKSFWSLFVYSWNRNVLDAELHKAASEADPTRFVNRCSGEMTTPWQKGGDTHFYFGWYTVQGKSMRAFDKIVRWLPANLRFVTEFGAQSFPNPESCAKFMDSDIRKIDWVALSRTNSLQIELMDHWVGLAQPDLATLIEKSQAYQSKMNRFYIDRIRRAKYNPGGGVIPFMFTDPNPAVQWSVVDYWRAPKSGYYMLRDAMRPIYAFAILDADSRKADGLPLRIDVYIVNDTLSDPGEIPISLTITDPNGKKISEHWAKTKVGPDSPALHALTVFDASKTPGTYNAVVVMDRPDDRFENAYTYEVE